MLFSRLGQTDNGDFGFFAFVKAAEAFLAEGFLVNIFAVFSFSKTVLVFTIAEDDVSVSQMTLRSLT